MMYRIGIGIGSDTIRAIVLRRGRIVWAYELQRDDARELRDELAELLQRIPVRRWRCRGVSAAVGPAYSQTRLVTGLPHATRQRDVTRIVAQAPARFFLRSTGAMVTTNVQVVEPGSAWAAAIDEPVVHAVAEACGRTGLRFAEIVPTVSVLYAGLEDSGQTWRDGNVAVEVVVNEGQLLRAERIPALGSEPGGTAVAKAPLASLGEDGWRYADAYGAAIVGRMQSLRIPRSNLQRIRSGVSRTRLVAASVAAAVALAAFALAPAGRAELASRRAERTLSELGELRANATRVRVELEQNRAVINGAAYFAGNTPPMTLLLGELTRLLPARSALTTLRADSSGVTVVALAQHAAHVLAGLERATGITNVEVVGPITIEVAGQDTVERVTLRFRVTDALGRPTDSNPTK